LSLVTFSECNMLAPQRHLFGMTSSLIFPPKNLKMPKT
jgi:hypothetical protein